MLGNNAIARIFEHCGLMNDLGLKKNEKSDPSYFPVVGGYIYIFFDLRLLLKIGLCIQPPPLQGE